ncbi:MAG: carbohydrate kinase family protein [Eubacterium sp.]|nr:carbohydrate kinase family protein [Eubacterium sp.]
MAEITCIGQNLIDCITRGVDRASERKKVFRAESISLSVGGDAINEATVLKRLGHDVRLVCGLGDDLAGRMILAAMKELGLDQSCVDISKDRPTPIANLMVDEDGSRDSINSDATMLEGYAPDPNVSADTKILSLASLFRAPLDQPKTVIDLVREAKKNDCLVCADTKVPTFRQMTLADIAEILPMIDYIFPNDAEAEFFTGRKEIEDMAAFFRDAGVRHVIIKAGADGSYIYGENESFHMKALPVDAIDGTGAGDNYVAGFLSGLLRGFSLYECSQYGTVCAAACVVKSGAGGGVQSRDEADALWKQWYGG